MARVTGHIKLVQRERGPVYYMKYRLADGRQVQKLLGPAWTERSRPPTGYYTRKTAEEALQAILTDARRGVLPEGRAKSGKTFGDACREWLRYVEHEDARAPSTVRDYRNVMDVHFLPRFGEETPVEQISTDDIDAFRVALLDGRRSRRTAQKVLVLLHGVFARAKRKKWIASNPAEDAEKVRVVASEEFNVLEPEQVAAVDRSARSDMLGALFTVAAFTGLRCPGEVTALRWEHVDFENLIVHVRRNYVMGSEGVTKGKRVRAVPMSDQALVSLERVSKRELFTEPGDLVFCTDMGEHLSGDFIRDEFYVAVNAAGLGHLRDKDDPIIPYDLRHTFGTLAVRTAPLSDVQAWMGHKHITTTMRYVHHVPQQVNAAKLSEAFRGATVPGEAVSPTLSKR